MKLLLKDANRLHSLFGYLPYLKTKEEIIMEWYKVHLVESTLNLIRLMYELCLDIAHLLLDQGLAEENQLCEYGEFTQYDMTAFSDVEDENIRKLVEIHEFASDAYNSFSDTNDISAFDAMELMDMGVLDEWAGVAERWRADNERLFAMEATVPRGFPCPEYTEEIFVPVYRFYLVKSVVTLDWYLQEVYGNLINLAMNGRFEEANARLRGEEDMCFDMTDFEGVDDPNVLELIKAHDVVKGYRDLLCQSNGVKGEEIELFIEEE